MALFLCPGKSNSCTYRVAKHAEYKQACAPKTVLTRYGKYFFSTEYFLRVFFEDVSTDKSRRFLIFTATRRIFRQSQTKVVGKVLYNLTVVHFNPEEKREFSLSLNIPRPSTIQCRDIIEQLRAQRLTFWSTLGQRRGEEGKEQVKKETWPNTFVDDCRYKMQTRNYGLSIKHGLRTVYITTAFKFASSCRRSKWSNNWKGPSPAGRIKENRTL